MLHNQERVEAFRTHPGGHAELGRTRRCYAAKYGGGARRFSLSRGGGFIGCQVNELWGVVMVLRWKGEITGEGKAWLTDDGGDYFRWRESGQEFELGWEK